MDKSDPLRDQLGRLVRESWVRRCRSIGDTKPSHLVPYDELSEADRETDRVIGEDILFATLEWIRDMETILLNGK